MKNIPWTISSRKIIARTF